MFNRSPVGKYHILVCGTTPCMLCGARTLSAAIKEHLSIDYGQTTPVSLGCAALLCMSSALLTSLQCLRPWTGTRHVWQKRPALLSNAHKLQAAIKRHNSN